MTTTPFTRRLNLHRAVVALSVTGAALALLPIVAAIVGGVAGVGGQRTAFASAPAGDYAVFSRAGELDDEILVARATEPSQPLTIASVSHLAGFPAHGVVAPDGRRVALVTVDAGSPAQPGASLLVLDLESGELLRVAQAIDHLQTPVWAPDSASLVVTRGADAAPGAITVVRVQSDASGESVVHSAPSALGIFPVGFDPVGRLLAVQIDGRGSTLLRDGAELGAFSAGISRDWKLSPDGASLAFVETVLEGGPRYEPRVIAVESIQPAVAAQSLALDAQALGVAWNPADASPMFGYESGASVASSEGVTSQQLASGFDVPLAFAKDGQALAVQHWTGDAFASPGEAQIQVVTDGERSTLPGATEFLGWAAR